MARQHDESGDRLSRMEDKEQTLALGPEQERVLFKQVLDRFGVCVVFQRTCCMEFSTTVVPTTRSKPCLSKHRHRILDDEALHGTSLLRLSQTLSPKPYTLHQPLRLPNTESITA